MNLSAIEYNDVVMDSSQLGLGSVPNTPTPPIISHNKRTAASMKRSHSSTPSPESTHGNNQMSHPQTPSVDPHSNHSSHTRGHNSHSHGQSGQPTAAAVSQSNGSPGSPVDVNTSESAKRRRFNSSPVRPWKSPSPPTVCSVPVGSSEVANSASNLLRHISVIRETPPILKPQVVAPTYHPHAHHYHHLVDPYAAAYHLYKNGSASGPPMTAQPAPPVPSSAAHHHWGAYN